MIGSMVYGVQRYDFFSTNHYLRQSKAAPLHEILANIDWILPRINPIPAKNISRRR